MTDRSRAVLSALQDSPVIAAVKNEEGLSRALESDCAVLFLLNTSILSAAENVNRVKEAGRLALVHADLVAGLGTKDDVAADFLAKNTRADGIISTRPAIIKRTRELGLCAIQRFFVVDSIAFENAVRQSSQADIVDILPGVMPSVLRRMTERLRQPVIASGLLREKQEVIAALSAGASAVSTTEADLWFL